MKDEKIPISIRLSEKTLTKVGDIQDKLGENKTNALVTSIGLAHIILQTCGSLEDFRLIDKSGNVNRVRLILT